MVTYPHGQGTELIKYDIIGTNKPMTGVLKGVSQETYIVEYLEKKLEDILSVMQEVEELPVKVIGLVKFVRRDFSI